MRRISWMVLLALACAAHELPESDAHVGPHPAGGSMLATHQFVEPAGTMIAFDGRPLDLVLSPDGRFPVGQGAVWRDHDRRPQRRDLPPRASWICR